MIRVEISTRIFFIIRNAKLEFALLTVGEGIYGVGFPRPTIQSETIIYHRKRYTAPSTLSTVVIYGVIYLLFIKKLSQHIQTGDLSIIRAVVPSVIS